MSWSSCINCHNMVSAYEKYCINCIRKHNLIQDEDWHKKYHKSIDILQELRKDQKDNK